MRATTRAAVAALLGLLIAASLTTSAQATKPVKAKPCPKGTIVVGSSKAPSACVPQQRSSTVDQLQQAVAVAAKRAKGKAKAGGKGPSKRARQLLRDVVALVEARNAANEPLFAAKPAGRAGRLATGAGTRHHGVPGGANAGPGLRAQAAAGGNATITNAPAEFGSQISAITNADGAVIGGRFQAGDVTLTMQAESDGIRLEVTDGSGAGGFVKYTPDSAPTPRCPTPAGDVPSGFDTKLTFGEVKIRGPYRVVIATSIIFDRKWHGYVGVSAKAEKFDVDATGALEVRAHAEDAKTGKVVYREGTRVYRAVLARTGLPIETKGASLIGGARFYGPKGAIKSSDDRAFASALGELVVTHIDTVPSALKDGDERWYEQRRCARVGVSSALPDEVVRGDTATWDIDVTDERGGPAADAVWTITSTCGTPTAPEARG